MTDICLVFPRNPDNRALSPTLAGAESMGLGYLASVLREHNFNVKIINAEQMSISNYDIIDIILNENPKIVGFSPVAVNMQEVINVAKVIKERNSSIHITMGGHHVSFVCSEILEEEECIDTIILGEGEYTLLNLANYVINNIGNMLEIDGLCYRKGTKVIIGKHQIIEDIDKLPMPSRDTLNEIILMQQRKEARIITSRGCIGNCSFCTTPKFYNRTWRGRNYIKVLDEISYLVSTYKIEYLWITDDSFIVNTFESQKRAEMICNEIINRKLNVKFRILCRADSFNSSYRLIPLLKKAGLDSIFIGFESGDDEILKGYNKGITTKENKKIIEELVENEIKIQIGFIMFSPYSTLESLRNNILFLREIQELYRFFPLTRTLDIFPGTSIYLKLLEDKLIIKDFSYKSNRKYDYSYKNPNIERIFNIIDICYDNKTDWLDKQLLQIKFVSIPQLLQKNGFSEMKRIENIYFEINEINYLFFSAIIENINMISEDYYITYNEKRKEQIENKIFEINTIMGDRKDDA